MTKVEAVDPLTVRFTLSIPYADLPAVTAGYQSMIVSESAMDTLTTLPRSIIALICRGRRRNQSSCPEFP